MGDFHSAEIDVDQDGWWFAVCACGWQGSPCPGREEAEDDYGDHRAWVATTEAKDAG